MDANNLKHVVGSYEQGKPAVIRFFGPVDYWTVNEFNEEFLWLQEYVKPSKIIVAINSEGGSVVYGMSTFSLINSCPIETECIVEGIAASMGSVIWAAGKRIYMHDYSLLMIHNPFIECVEKDDNDMRAEDVFKKQIETIYVKRFGMSEEQVRSIMDGEGNLDGTFFSAQDAVDAGIISSNHVIETEKAVFDMIPDVIAEAKEGGKDVHVREIFTSIAAEISNEKLISKIETIHNRKQQNQIQQSMNEKEFSQIVAKLGLPGDATVVSISAKVDELIKAKNEFSDLQGKYSELEIKFKGKETEATNLKDELTAVKADLKKYKDAEASALKAEIESVVDAAVEAGKISNDARESWIQMANNNFDVVKQTLASIEGRKVVSEEIAKDPNNNKDAKDAMTEAERKVSEKVAEVVGANFELKKF